VVRSGGSLVVAALMTGLVLAAPGAARGEQTLLVSTPPGFKMAWSHATPDGAMKMMEYVPDGQTVESWQQMITVQHFPKLAAADPLALLSSWTQKLVSVCPKAQVSRAPQAPVNGHAAVRVYVHVAECGPRAPESILAVMIKGEDAMHMIQHAWRPQPPTREQLQAAMGGLDRARLCRAGDAACAK
jgi:hypothetical protein